MVVRAPAAILRSRDHHAVPRWRVAEQVVERAADLAAALKWLLAIHAAKLLAVQAADVQAAVADQAAAPRWLLAILAARLLDAQVCRR